MKTILKIFMPLIMMFVSLFSITFAQGAEGVDLTGSCLFGMGRDCFKYEKILGIDDSQKQNYSALSIAQDVIFAAMYAVGTVLTVVIIWCGLGYIFAARNAKDTNSYKNGLINALIGALLVRGAYAIVRLIQYIAKG